jgi:murein DD-endopeptidase MepM/ murein hydrolase activator NlpD
MINSTDSFLFKVRLLIGSVIIIFALMLLPIFTSLITTTPKVHAVNSNSSSLEESPNIITSGMFSASDDISKTTNSIGQNVNSTANSISYAFARSGKFLIHGVSKSATFVMGGAWNIASITVHGVWGITSFTVRGVSSTVGFALNTTGKVFGVIAHPPTISSVIHPADHAPVEVISNPEHVSQPNKPKPAQPTPAAQAQLSTDSSASWPIHGEITTEFGVPHRPYQTYHTGIDISDGKRSGITPIHPFKPGKVVQVIHSNVGLGNHVIVDHGNGITSVYGHMYSTNVQVGQQVDKNSVLGLEGTTGASTGPHVHFEIYLNGKLQNPHNFVPGHP